MDGASRDSNPQSTLEEEAKKRNSDCVYFLASPLTCIKGADCEFRHSEVARVNPRDCWFWQNGNCLNPKCAFRHPFTTSGFQNPLPGGYDCLGDSAGLLQTPRQLDPPNQTFVKVYKSGCVGRSLDIARFSSYHELHNELSQIFGLESLMEDPQRSGWQLVFVDRENDVLLMGDDPWEAFVNNVWYIKILSPQDVQKMGAHKHAGESYKEYSNTSRPLGI